MVDETHSLSFAAIDVQRTALWGSDNFAMVPVLLAAVSALNPLTQPPTIRGEATMGGATLSITVGRISADNLGFNARSYNGSSPGPTILVRPNSNLRVIVVNKLGPHSTATAMAHSPNSTSIHLHGLHASPYSEFLADGIGHRSVEPGETRTFEYELRDDHPPGTYWYHPHLTSNAVMQVAEGMAGVVIVEDDQATLPPALAAMADRVLVIQHFHLARTSPPRNTLLNTVQRLATEDTGMWAEELGSQLDRAPTGGCFSFLACGLGALANVPPGGAGEALLINGQPRPTAALRPGEWQRWRLLNADPTFSFIIELPGCELKLLAIDGLYLLDGAARDVRNVSLVNGARRDVAVRCAAPGNYQLRTAGGPAVSDVAYMANITLMDVVVAGAPLAMAVPTDLPPLPKYLTDLRSETPAQQYTVDMKVGFSFDWFQKDGLSDAAPLAVLYMLLIAYLRWWCGCRPWLSLARLCRRESAAPRLVLDEQSSSVLLHPGAEMSDESTKGRQRCWGWCSCRCCCYCLLLMPLLLACLLALPLLLLEPDISHINGRAFMGLTDLATQPTMRLGDVQEWIIVQPSETAHPFHMHVHHFQLISASGPNTFGLMLGDYYDSTVAPVPALGGGNYTIRFRPVHYAGPLAVHCHVFAHVYDGMVMTARVLE